MISALSIKLAHVVECLVLFLQSGGTNRNYIFERNDLDGLIFI